MDRKKGIPIVRHRSKKMKETQETNNFVESTSPATVVSSAPSVSYSSKCWGGYIWVVKSTK